MKETLSRCLLAERAAVKLPAFIPGLGLGYSSVPPNGPMAHTAGKDWELPLWPQKSLSGNSYVGLKAGPHTSMAPVLVFFGQLGHFYLRDGCSSPLYFLPAPAVSPLPPRVSTEGWPFPKGCLGPSSNFTLSVSCPPLRPGPSGLGRCVRLGRHSESRCDCVYVSRERGVSALA